MRNLSMCRICLATDVRLCSIARSLQEMYEKLTDLTFKREDRRPLVACFICHARLQNCYRLRMSCLRSEELLTEMMSSSVLVPQQVSSTNTFRVETVLHLSLGHVLQDSTEVHVKEEPPEVIHDAELDQQNAEDFRMEVQELCEQRDENNQFSHLEDPLDIIKEEADDVVTGARVFNEPKLAALKDFEDATTNKIKIEVIENEETESITIKEEPRNFIDLNKCKNVVTFIVNEVCEEKSTEKSLDQNVSTISSSKSKQFSCETCNKCFTEKGYLKNHLRIHTGEKPFQCNVCKKSFIQKGNLIKHVRTHTGDKPYQCNVCKKCFSQKVSLQTHIRIHTGDKPYQCNVCKKSFIQKGYLKTHSRTHTGEKPYQCNVCKKSFSMSGHYSRHMRLHKL